MCVALLCPAAVPSVGYTRYLLDTLHKRELLTWLTLTPQRWWAVLHHVDDCNYGGVEATVSSELWEAGGVVGPAPTPGAEAAANAAAAAEIDEAEIGTPGGPRLRWVGAVHRVPGSAVRHWCTTTCSSWLCWRTWAGDCCER